MSKEIAKGNVLLQKEAELKKVWAEYKKVLRNLKSNKTRLKNDREKIATIQREVITATQVGEEKLMNLQKKLIKSMERVRKSRKIPKQEKGEIQYMLEDMKSQIPTDEDMQRMTEEFFEQKAKEDYERRLYERFHKRPPEEDQKSIRKIYIQLSKRFHPDLAKNNRELAQFNTIMVRVVQAYESGDIAELLEIQKELADYENNSSELPTGVGQDAVISLIQQKINRQAHELELLKGQLSRTREELLELRNSEEGQLLSHYKRCQKAGIDLLVQIKEEMDERIAMLQMIIHNLDKYAKTGKLSEEFIQAIMFQSNHLYMEEEVDEELDYWELMEMLENI